MNKNKIYIVVFLIFAFILGLITFGEQMFHSTMAMFRSDQKEEVVYEDELIKNKKNKSEKKKKEIESESLGEVEEFFVDTTATVEYNNENKILADDEGNKHEFKVDNDTRHKEKKDSDNDGVNDLTDECPMVWGTRELYGCPDSDGDGIGDSRDKCPFEKGSTLGSGCP